MEKAVALSPASLAAAGRLGRWDRVYLGSSFCQALLPGARDLEAALKAGARGVTLATPLLTGAALAAFLPELKRMLKMFPGLEISVNDLGLMTAVRVKFGRGPKLSLARPVSIDLIRMDKTALVRFMRKHGVSRLESDEADMVRQLPGSFPFPVDFHYPFKYRAMSRLCPRTGRLNSACAGTCAGRAERISGPDGCILELFENGYFTRNRPFTGGRVERLVFTPSCPPGKR